MRQPSLFENILADNMPPLEDIRLFNITHYSNLVEICRSGSLLSDAKIRAEAKEFDTPQVSIAYNHIKERRLTNRIPGYSNLHVGDCVPFYFCPRSVMLYIASKGQKSEYSYAGPQREIIHLSFRLKDVYDWALGRSLRVAFTRTNAGSYFFDAWKDLQDLDQLNWTAINATDWRDCRDEKQAEFLVEDHVPLSLATSIGVMDQEMQLKVGDILRKCGVSGVQVDVRREWYY